MRAGIEGTPQGQLEAACSLALSEAQVLTRVVLPPALGRCWPVLVSQIVIVMLGSAVCGQISAQALSYAANLIQSRNFRAFEATLIAIAIYLGLSVGVRGLLNWPGASLHLRPPARLPAAGRRGAPDVFEFSLWDIFRNLLLAARWTVGLSLLALIGGGLVGQALLLMQRFLAYFGLALLGPNVSAWVAAGMALTLYASAVLTEIWRGCVMAITKGQWEAADSLALSFTEQMRHGVGPQALRNAVPATVGVLVQVIKGIDLTLWPGEELAIIDKSGSGKSTLLRCVNELETF